MPPALEGRKKFKCTGTPFFSNNHLMHGKSAEFELFSRSRSRSCGISIAVCLFTRLTAISWIMIHTDIFWSAFWAPCMTHTVACLDLGSDVCCHTYICPQVRVQLPHHNHNNTFILSRFCWRIPLMEYSRKYLQRWRKTPAIQQCWQHGGWLPFLTNEISWLSNENPDEASLWTPLASLHIVATRTTWGASVPLCSY